MVLGYNFALVFDRRHDVTLYPTPTHFPAVLAPRRSSSTLLLDLFSSLTTRFRSSRCFAVSFWYGTNVKPEERDCYPATHHMEGTDM